MLASSFPVQEEKDTEKMSNLQTMKTGSLGERVKPKLPHDMVLDILPRLPVNSLLRFKRVSKGWAALISDPQFIKNHLNRAIKDHHNHGIIVWLPPFYDFLFSVDIKRPISDTDDDHEYVDCVTFMKLDLPLLNTKVHKLHLPLQDTKVYKRVILGSCHGLICLVDQPCRRSNEDTGIFYFFNPSTREVKKILDSRFQPQAELQQHCLFAHSRYGFGYDSSTDDYKLVKLLPYVVDGDYKLIVTVYTLRSNTWRKLENCCSYACLWTSQTHRSNGGIHCNGAIHWFSHYNNSIIIASFDLSDETFRNLPLPIVHCVNLYQLAVFKECLCLLRDLDDGNNFEIWVMKEYGVWESWTKFIIRTQNYCLGHFCSSPRYKPRKIAVVPLVLYNNPNEESSRILLVCGGSHLIEAKTYVKSLLSPKLLQEQQSPDPTRHRSTIFENGDVREDAIVSIRSSGQYLYRGEERETASLMEHFDAPAPGPEASFGLGPDNSCKGSRSGPGVVRADPNEVASAPEFGPTMMP